MSPVCPCALVQLSQYICVHCLVLSFHVLGSSLSVFELCLSLSIWATEFLLSACKVLLCAWSMRFLRPFATSMSFWVCIHVHELPSAIFLCPCATSLLFFCVLRPSLSIRVLRPLLFVRVLRPSVHWLSRSPRLGRCSRGATRTRLRELFQRPTLSSNLISFTNWIRLLSVI